MDIVNIVTSSFETTKISPLEAIMLICWGTSWPVSIFKALRTKKVYGKSPIFMSLIAVGYVSAILHKILYSYDYLVLLYLFNLSMILTDLYLYNRYNLRDTRASKRIKTREITTNKISAAPNVS
jgi:hypothetical protein